MLYRVSYLVGGYTNGGNGSAEKCGVRKGNNVFSRIVVIAEHSVHMNHGHSVQSVAVQYLPCYNVGGNAASAVYTTVSFKSGIYQRLHGVRKDYRRYHKKISHSRITVKEIKHILSLLSYVNK